MHGCRLVLGFWSTTVLTLVLIASVSLNALTAMHLRRVGSTDDSDYSYLGDDHPTELPIRLDTVALTVEDTEEYGISSRTGWASWDSLDHFPRAPGFVRLGPNARTFGVSMFHQMHCLGLIRTAIISGNSDRHTHHCLNFIRMMVLCSADITLDSLNVLNGSVEGTDGIGVTHVCRDWSQVYDFVAINQRS